MTSLRDSFYVTLPSHDPNEMYVNTNKPYMYTVAMPYKIKLPVDEWEVGLAEIFIPDYGFNIKAPRHVSLKISYNREILDEQGIGLAQVVAVDYIGIREGRYSARTWVRAINERIKETMVPDVNAKKKNLFRGRLRYHDESNRIEVVLGTQESMSITDPMLAHMTGWEEVNHELVNMGTGTMRTFLPYLCRFDANGEQMMVYTNIIEYSTVGSENVALLRTLHLEPDGLPCHRECTEIQYHPLRVQDMDNIQIHLLNTFGQPMDFKEGTHSTVVLHFRRRQQGSPEEKELKEV